MLSAMTHFEPARHLGRTFLRQALAAPEGTIDLLQELFRELHPRRVEKN